MEELVFGSDSKSQGGRGVGKANSAEGVREFDDTFSRAAERGAFARGEVASARWRELFDLSVTAVPPDGSRRNVSHWSPCCLPLDLVFDFPVGRQRLFGRSV
jgi:hypothetical protein